MQKSAQIRRFLSPARIKSPGRAGRIACTRTNKSAPVCTGAQVTAGASNARLCVATYKCAHFHLCNCAQYDADTGARVPANPRGIDSGGEYRDALIRPWGAVHVWTPLGGDMDKQRRRIPSPLAGKPSRIGELGRAECRSLTPVRMIRHHTFPVVNSSFVPAAICVVVRLSLYARHMLRASSMVRLRAIVYLRADANSSKLRAERRNTI